MELTGGVRLLNYTETPHKHGTYGIRPYTGVIPRPVVLLGGFCGSGEQVPAPDTQESSGMVSGGRQEGNMQCVSTGKLFLWILASTLTLCADRGRDKGDRARHRRHPWLPKLHQRLPIAWSFSLRASFSYTHATPLMKHTHTHTHAPYTLLDDSHRVSSHTSRPSMLNYGLWAAASAAS